MQFPYNAAEIVGRSIEQDQLHKLLKRSIQSQGQVVLLTGEAGIGKTQLLTYLANQAGNADLDVNRGQCTEQDQEFPFAPIVDGLRTRFSGAPVEELKHIIGPFQSELIRLLPELALKLETSAPSALHDPEAEKRRLFEVLIQIYQRMSQSGLLLIFEDIHWCDDNSLEFIRILTRRVAKLPIMVALSSRDRPPDSKVAKLQAYLNRSENALSISLQPLSQPDLELLLKVVLQTTEPIHPALLQQLNTLTQGNPLYAQQIVYMLQQNRQINLVNGAWIVTNTTGTVDIPRSIKQTVQHQLLALKDDDTQLLQYAAVAGREFNLSLLQGTMHIDNARLLVTIKKLIERHFFDEMSRDRFAFHHTIIRQAIYDSMLIRERQSIHQAILLYLETTESSVNLADLAYHAYNAETWETAYVYGFQAGQHALSLHSPQAAVEQLTHAVQAAQHMDRTDIATVYRLRGDAFSKLSRFQPAHDDYETALHLAEHSGDRMEAWESLDSLGKLWAARDYQQVKDYCERALALAREMEDKLTIAHSLNRLGNWYLNVGYIEHALKYHEEALAIFDDIEDMAGKAETFDQLGMATSYDFRFAQAVTYYRSAIELYRKLDDRQSIVSTLANLGLMTLNSRMILESIQIAREIGLYSAEAYGCLCAGNVFSNLGQMSEGIAYVQQAMELAQTINHSEWLAAAHLRLGLIYVDLFAADKAAEHAEIGMTLAQQVGSQLFTDRAMGLQVRILIAQNKLDEAEALLADNQPLAKFLLHQFELTTARSELAIAQGQPGKIIALAEEIERISKHAEAEFAALPFLSFYAPFAAQAFLFLEKREQAMKILQGARDIAQRFNLISLTWKIEVLLGSVLIKDDQSTAQNHFNTARHSIRQISETVPANLRQNFLNHALAKIPASSGRDAAKSEAHDLTRRETEIVREIALGKNNQQIADDLHITIKTVEAHITRVLSKLNMTSRTQIALWAVDHKL